MHRLISLSILAVVGCTLVENPDQPKTDTKPLEVLATETIRSATSALATNDLELAAQLFAFSEPVPANDGDFVRWVATQRAGLQAQFGDTVEVEAVESVAPGRLNVYILKEGRPHPKPIRLVLTPSGWRINAAAETKVAPADNRIVQAAMYDRYTFPTVMTNYTNVWQSVTCTDNIASSTITTNLGNVFYNSTQTPWCPSWECTWFGSTCTSARLTACSPSYLCAKTCANQVFGDDVWVNGQGIGCYTILY